MRNLCTLSDYGYLDRGLVLYNSLMATSSESFILYYLCIDEKSYDKLRELNLEGIRPLLVSDYAEFENTSEEYKEYCWSLAARLCSYLMDNEDVSDIMYIDSDICFFNDINLAYEEIGQKSIGIIPHIPQLKTKVASQVGAYNVGIIYFKNDEDGRGCLDFWKDCVVDLNNPYQEEYGTCGDQKYLELFEQKFPDSVCIIETEIAQGAPWNFLVYDYSAFSPENKIVVIEATGASLPLVFVHFSKINLDYENGKWELLRRPDGKFLFPSKFFEPSAVQGLCDEYFEMAQEAVGKYQL